MLIKVGNRLINTDHIVLAEWQESSPHSNQTPQLHLSFTSTQGITLADKQARKVWDYLCSEVEKEF